jgi:hypothetical protein
LGASSMVVVGRSLASKVSQNSGVARPPPISPIAMRPDSALRAGPQAGLVLRNTRQRSYGFTGHLCDST